jgi:hypothetical protein
MKKLLVAMIGVIMAVGVVSLSYAMDNTTNTTTLSVSPLKSASGMFGHVTLTAYDENGNIKAYRQLDNVITNQMDDCLSKLAFAETAGVFVQVKAQICLTQSYLVKELLVLLKQQQLWQAILQILMLPLDSPVL